MKIILTDEEREYFRAMGAKGGKAAAAKMTPKERQERARKGAMAREANKRKRKEKGK